LRAVRKFRDAPDVRVYVTRQVFDEIEPLGVVAHAKRDGLSTNSAGLLYLNRANDTNKSGHSS